MTTLLLSPERFAAAEATVDGDAHHHLFRVKRLQPGDAVRVVDGRGNARAATIAAITKREATLELGDVAPSREPDRAVDLLVAPPKPERAAWLVEKAVELGVRSVRFVATGHDARAFAPSQLERLRRVAVAALEQCGRARLPDVDDGGALAEAIADARASGATPIVLDAAGARRAPSLGAAPAALVVGPEGGWSEPERALFAATAVPLWSLGPTILRVETAAIAGTAALLAG